MQAAGVAFEDGQLLKAKAVLAASASDAVELEGASADVAFRRRQHNQALLDYCSAGIRRPEILLAQLDELDDGDISTGVERAVLRYNRAVLRVHMARYNQAEEILQSLLLFREHLEQDHLVKILLLLLDLNLRNWACEKASEVLNELTTLQATMTTDDSKTKDGRAISMNELSFWIHVYGARLHLLSDNQKVARKEVKSALHILNRDHVSEPRLSPKDVPLNNLKATALLLKARLEYLRENYPKTIKLLNNVKCCDVNDSSLSAVYLNNIGCVHYGLKRYDAAGFYFSKAASACVIACESSKPEGGGFSGDLAQPILYNSGVHMFRQIPEMAIQCFEYASPHLCSRPLLWIRMAECCISTYEQWEKAECAKLVRSDSNRSALLVLTPSPLRPSIETQATVSKQLSRAHRLYINALSLTTDKSSQLYNSAVLGLAFVCLRLGRPGETLHWCKAATSTQKTLHNCLYKAEALCRLGNVDEAIAVLDAATPEASSSLHSLLSSAFCLRNELVKALTCALRALVASPSSIAALRALVYVLLRMGRSDEAIMTIRRRTPPPHLLEHL